MEVFIAHNSHGGMCPSATSQKGNVITFDFDKVSDRLKKLLWGKIGIMNLTVTDMWEIKKAQRGIKTVGQGTINNIFEGSDVPRLS